MKKLSKLVSIAIPCYEMHGNGLEFLEFNFNKFKNQKYDNLQIVISDHSKNDEIQQLCNKWNNVINIKYVKYEEKLGSSSANINNAINHCDGELIKILFQDDFLYHDDSISEIVENFEDKDEWLVTSCLHTTNGTDFYYEHKPGYNDKIHLGINTISSPSVLTIRNNRNERFDERLIWLMDCDMYRQLYDRYGLPKVLDKVNVVNRLWGNRLSDTISQDIKDNENHIISKKYQ